LKAEGCSSETAFKVLGITKTSYYRWKSGFKIRSLAGLENKSRRPNKARTSLWSSDLEQQVLVCDEITQCGAKLKFILFYKEITAS
jgi:hypothetical protein